MNRSVGGLVIMCGFVAALGAGCGDDTSAETSSTETTVSPLAALFGFQNETPEESRRKQLEVENLTAECMREEGWEYKPVDWGAQDFSQGQPDEEWGSEAFGKKYGYGIVFGYEQNEEAFLLGGGNDQETSSTGPVFVNPNDEYVSSLTEDEQQQYNESLYGEQMMEPAVTAGDEATADTAATYVPQGCAGMANEEVYGNSDPTRDNPDLADRIEDFFSSLEEDPRIQAATADWQACIADKIGDIEIYGKPPENVDAMYQYVDSLKNDALGLKTVPWDGTEELENMYTGMTNEDGTGYAVVGEPVPIPEAELEELRTTELDIWAKDHECQQDAKIREIRARVEQELVDELRAEFPELGLAS